MNTDEICEPGFCNFCPIGSYLDVDICAPCEIADCLTCPNGNDCLSCREGTYLADSGLSCEICPAHCKTCYDNENCEKCADGYFNELVSMGDDLTEAVWSDECVACDENCATCYAESTRCQTCHPGYNLRRGNRCIGRATTVIQILFTNNFN